MEETMLFGIIAILLDGRGGRVFLQEEAMLGCQ
jgi:hypothetical protein